MDFECGGPLLSKAWPDLDLVEKEGLHLISAEEQVRASDPGLVKVTYDSTRQRG